MVIGLVSGEAGKMAMQPFSGDLFKGMLAFFLLDMGLMTARSAHQGNTAIGNRQSRTPGRQLM